MSKFCECGDCQVCEPNWEASKAAHPAGRARVETSEGTVLLEASDLRFVPMYEELSEFEQNLQNVADVNVRLLLSKHRDYGPLNISNSPGGALNGLRVRMHDKLARINHLIDSGADPEHESLIDSFIDLGNYALIAQLVIRGEWPKK